jgi:hypothetical protein
VLVEGAASLFEVHLKETPVVRPAGRHHHVVDRGRQVGEKLFEGCGVGGVEGRGAQSLDLLCRALEGFGIPAGEDNLGAFRAGSSGRFEPDAGATADHDDGLSEEFWFGLDGNNVSCSAHYFLLTDFLR